VIYLYPASGPNAVPGQKKGAPPEIEGGNTRPLEFNREKERLPIPLVRKITERKQSWDTLRIGRGSGENTALGQDSWVKQIQKIGRRGGSTLPGVFIRSKYHTPDLRGGTDKKRHVTVLA